MLEVIRMWKLMRFFTQNHHHLVILDRNREYFEKLLKDKLEDVNDERLKLICSFLQKRNPRTQFDILVVAYSMYQKFGRFDPSQELYFEPSFKKLNRIQRCIHSCINEGYIVEDEEDTSLICIHVKGEKFAGIGGLAKAIGKELSDFIREWRVVVIAIIAFLGAINNEVIWTWVKSLFFD